MANIVLDTTASGHGNGVNSLTLTAITTAVANELLVMTIHYSSGSVTNATTVTGGGLTWASITSRVANNNSSTNGYTEFWYALAVPKLTSIQFVVNVGGSAFPQMTAELAAYKNTDISANGANAIGAVTTTFGNTTSSSQAITTTRANSLVIGMQGVTKNVTLTAGASQTIAGQVSETTGGFSVAAIDNQNAVTVSSGSSVTASFSSAGSNPWAMAAVELKAPSTTAMFINVFEQSLVTDLIYPIPYGAYTEDDLSSLSGMTTFESDAGGRKLDIALWYQAWGSTDGSQNFESTWMDNVRNHGSIPMVTWEPWVYTNGTTQSTYSLANIIAGNFDAYITQFAIDAKNWGHIFYLRFAHEMNGNWYPWSELVNGNSAGQYANAWKHVHDIFANYGATNVQWVWCPSMEYSGSIALSGLYPGDSYVDVLGMDGYNFGTNSGNSWTTFTNVFSTTYTDVTALATKPLLICETSSAEQGGNKAAWITSFLTTELATFPKIQGFIWFNKNNPPDWTIESSSAATAAFKQVSSSLIQMSTSISVFDSSTVTESVTIQRFLPINVFDASIITESFGSGLSYSAGASQATTFGNVLSSSASVSAAIWFQVTATPSSNFDVMFGFGNTRWFFIWQGATTSLAFNIKISGSEKSSLGGAALTQNKTYLAIGTYDSSISTNNLTIRIYDSTGTLITSSQSSQTGSIDSVGNALQIAHDPVRGFYSSVSVDDAKIWHTVLTTAQQDALAKMTDFPTSGLDGWWTFDEGTGTSVFDKTGNGNTGTNSNSPTWIKSFMPNAGQVQSGRMLNLSVSDNSFAGLFPGTVTQDSSGSFSWGTLNGVQQIGSPIASGALNLQAPFNNILNTNFGFNVPSGATITGVLVEVNRLASQQDDINARYIIDNSVKLIKAGTATGSDKADLSNEWDSTQYVTKSYGGSSDLWGITLTPSDVNASNFGVSFGATGDDESGGTTSANIDFIRMTVYYTLGGQTMFVSDASTTNTVDLPNVFDSSTVTENTAILIPVFKPIVFDSSTVTDSVQILLQDFEVLNDVSAITESVTTRVVYTINVSDSSTVTNVITQILQKYNLSVFDSSTVTESVTNNPTLNLNIFESSAVTETPLSGGVGAGGFATGMLLAVLGAGTSGNLIEITSFVSLSDSSAVTDVSGEIILPASFGIGIIEFANPSESLSMQAGVMKTISVFDSSAVSDVSATIPLLQPRQIVFAEFSAVTESLTIQASYALSIFDSSTVTDVPSLQPTLLLINTSDFSIVTESTPYQIIVQESLANIPTTGTIKNDAVWNNGGYIVLTPALNTKNGEFEYSGTLPTDFEVTTDIYVSGAADSIYFYWGCSQTPTNEDFPAGGYIFSFDEYGAKNEPYHLTFNGTLLSTQGIIDFADAKFHTARIEVQGSTNTVTVFLDNIQKFTYTDTTRSLPGTLFGWGARTGGQVAEQRIRNMQINTLQPVKVIETTNDSVSDSSAATESSTVIVIDLLILSDSSTVTDNITTTIVDEPIVFDSSAVTDIPVVSLNKLFISIFDSSTVTDTILNIYSSDNSVIFDASAVTDVPALTIVDFVVVFDSSTATDILSIILVNEPVVFDASAVTENIQVLQIYEPIISDSSTVTDVITKISLAYSINVFDSSTVTEFLIFPTLINVFDSSVVADIVITNQGQYIVSVFESSAVTELPIVTVYQLVSVSDSSAVTDASTTEKVLLELMPSPNSGEHQGIRIWTP